MIRPIFTVCCAPAWGTASQAAASPKINAFRMVPPRKHSFLLAEILATIARAVES